MGSDGIAVPHAFRQSPCEKWRWHAGVVKLSDVSSDRSHRIYVRREG